MNWRPCFALGTLLLGLCAMPLASVAAPGAQGAATPIATALPANVTAPAPPQPTSTPAAPVGPPVPPADHAVIGTWTAKDLALIGGQFLTVLIAGAAVWASLRNTEHTANAAQATADAQRWKEANQAEILKLEAILQEFHTPFLVRSGANNNMAQDLRDRLKQKNYRMLIELLDPAWLPRLSKGDQTIVKEVCSTALTLRAFIEEHAHVVDAGLAEHLSRASAHFRMLHLAYERQLGSDPEPLKPYVYPRELDIALKADRERIENRLRQLRAEPTKNHGLIKPFVLPEDAVLPPRPAPVRGTPQA